MSDAQLIQRITKRFDKFEKVLAQERKHSETWVKASTIKRLTIWKTASQRQYAVKLGFLKKKKDDTGIWYLWESVNSVHHEVNKLS